jgi:hypothetical protein
MSRADAVLRRSLGGGNVSFAEEAFAGRRSCRTESSQALIAEQLRAGRRREGRAMSSRRKPLGRRTRHPGGGGLQKPVPAWDLLRAERPRDVHQRLVATAPTCAPPSAAGWARETRPWRPLAVRAAARSGLPGWDSAQPAGPLKRQRRRCSAVGTARGCARRQMSIGAAEACGAHAVPRTASRYTRSRPAIRNRGTPQSIARDPGIPSSNELARDSRPERVGDGVGHRPHQHRRC